MKHGHAWRREDVEQQAANILRIAKREPGWSCTRIATAAGASHTTVRNVLREAGLYPRPAVAPEAL